MSEEKMETRILNEELVPKLLADVDDPSVRNLVRLAVSDVRKRFIRWEGQSEEDWRAALPSADFDIAFFVRAAITTFSKQSMLLRLMYGESLEESSGWKIE